ncbi:MAG TPA: hypothetical protein PLS94_10695 [Prolixibacteraceae bacterium]|nr:hypothetical protein [Prolixibacteraceae bacterium]
MQTNTKWLRTINVYKINWFKTKSVILVEKIQIHNTMGGEGSTMAMISSLKNNRNLIQKISPLERRSKYLKKLKLNNQVNKTASPHLLNNIREEAKAEQRRYKNTLIFVFSFLMVLLVIFLVFWI